MHLWIKCPPPDFDTHTNRVLSQKVSKEESPTQLQNLHIHPEYFMLQNKEWSHPKDIDHVCG